MAHYIIVFDVFDSRRRRRLVKILENFAYRIQISVFAMKCDDRTMARLKTLVDRTIDSDEDSVLIFPLMTQNWENRIVMGIEETGLKVMGGMEKDAVIL